MIYEIVWWVVVSFGFLQELCKTAKNKKVPIREFVQKGSNPPQPTTKNVGKGVVR